MDNEIAKHVLKTGTLTLGLVCKDGIVIAADKRQSYGAQGGGVSYISGNADKIQQVNERMVATTAGTASDSRKVLSLLSAELRLKELRTRTKTSISQTAHFLSNMVFQNIRTPSMIPSIAHFLLGGYDDSGVALFDISPDGYIQEVETYAATGSGFMQAHPILDSEYKKGMSVEEGVKLATKCIRASMGREPSVGGGIDIFTVKKGEVKSIVAQDAVTEFKNRN
jgi:proteasome beta subunit